MDWFEDTKCGASELDDRPGLVGAVAALSRHGAGLLLVAKRDRLARDVAVAALIRRSVLRAGARVISADGMGNGEEPGEQFLGTVIDGAAAYERALIRQRTKAAAAVKKSQGQRAGTVPYGYRVADQGPRNKHGRVQCIEQDPDEQAVLRGIAELHGEGLSIRGIAKALQGAGILGRAGQPLQPTQVARLLRRLGRPGPPPPSRPDRPPPDAPADPDRPPTAPPDLGISGLPTEGVNPKAKEPEDPVAVRQRIAALREQQAAVRGTDHFATKERARLDQLIETLEAHLPAAPADIRARLRLLGDLMAEGLITPEEFQARRAAILAEV